MAPAPDKAIQRQVAIRRILMAVAAVLFAAALAMFALVLTVGQYNSRKEDDCRSRIAGQVSQAQGDITIAVGDGLRGLRRGDVVMQEQADEDYGKARGRLEDALAARDGAEETCRSTALVPF